MQRQKVIQEIRETEEIYVNMMKNVLIEQYHQPISAAIGKEPALKIEILTQLFSNLTSIYQFSSEHLLPSLKATENIGEVFQNYNPFFRLYLSYLENYEVALTTHISLLKVKNSIYKKICDASENKEKLSLPAFLIQPVQRIPRYILLLESLLQNSDSTSEEYKIISTSISNLKLIAIQINQKIGESKTEQYSDQILRLSSNVRKVIQDYFLPHRKLLKIQNFSGYITEFLLSEDDLKKLKKIDVEFILFNDLLLFVNSETCDVFSFLPSHLSFKFSKKSMTINSPGATVYLIISRKDGVLLSKELTQLITTNQPNNNNQQKEEQNFLFTNGNKIVGNWNQDFSSVDGLMSLTMNGKKLDCVGVFKKKSASNSESEISFLNFEFVSGIVSEYYAPPVDPFAVAHSPPSPSIKEKSLFSHGKKNGISEIYYTTGELAKLINYVDGKKNGECVSFHKNGKRAGLCHYVDDSIHGDYFVWHSNGQLAERAFMVDNWFEGPYERWYPDGSSGEYFVYRNHVCVEYRSVLSTVVKSL